MKKRKKKNHYFTKLPKSSIWVPDKEDLEMSGPDQ